MSDPASASIDAVRRADLRIYPSVTNKIEVLAEHDSRFTADRLAAATRAAIAAWVMAVDGDQGRLVEIGEPHDVSYLLQPDRRPWRVAPGPQVTDIVIWRLEPEPGEVSISFDFVGRRLFTDPAEAKRASALRSGEPADAEIPCVGMIKLALDRASGHGDPWPWRLTSGHTQTLDEYRGYTFTVRRELPGEFERRTGLPAPSALTGWVPVEPLTDGRPRRFRLLSGFAEHDEKFGSTADVDFTGEVVPTRDEAEALINPAIWEETTRALGPGDWRPSMNWLDVIELVDNGSFSTDQT
jgi:hypothetical protein